MSNLIKTGYTEYLPGVLARPAQPYIAPQPAWTEYRRVETCSTEPPTTAWSTVVTPAWECTTSEGVEVCTVVYRFSQTKSSIPGQRTCGYSTVTVNHPANPGQPYLPAVDAQPPRVAQNRRLGWNSGAVSINSVSGAGGYTFKVPTDTIGAVVGFTTESHPTHSGQIRHGLYLSRGVAQAMESGALVGPSSSYTDSSVLAVQRKIDGTVVYLVGGTTLHTSVVPSTGLVSLGAALYSAGDSVVDAVNVSVLPNEGSVSGDMLQMLGFSSDYETASSFASMRPLRLGAGDGSVGRMVALGGMTSNKPYGEASNSMLQMLGAAYGPTTTPAFAVVEHSLFPMQGFSTGVAIVPTYVSGVVHPVGGLASSGAYGEADGAVAPMTGFAYSRRAVDAEAEAAMRVPTVTATGSATTHAGGTTAAPSFAATAFGGANSKAAMKKAALAVTTTTVEIGHATTRAPASTTVATGLTGGVARTYVSMPFEVSATGRVSTSAGVYAVMPKASVAASGSRRVASAAATAPRPALTATGTAHESANASARMPLASLIGYGGAVLSVGSGRPTVSASAVTGSVGVVTATLPLVVLSSTATQHERGGAVLRMPSLVVGPSGRVVAVMPAGRLTSIGHAVVAVTQEAYVLNMNSLQVDGQDVVMGGQLTRYTDFPFTKVVRYLGSYYGVASDGLYLLEGDTNNGAPIEWAFTTCTTDFKAPMKKTVASVYFGGELGPEAEFMVACGELPDQMHQYTTTKQALQRNHRQKFGLGRKARYYAFGVAGDGELNLDSLEFEVANMTRRI